MGKLLFTLKLLIVHLLYILYSGILWTRLYMVAEKRGFGKAGTITAAVVWSLVYVALNFFLIAACLKSEYVYLNHLFVFMYCWFYISTAPKWSFPLRISSANVTRSADSLTENFIFCPGKVKPRYQSTFLNLYMHSSLLWTCISIIWLLLKIKNYLHIVISNICYFYSGFSQC